MTRDLYKKHILHPGNGEAVKFTPRSINFEWCCDCKLRHVTQYSIETNDYGDQVVVQRVWRDDWATDMQRRELRRQKKAKRAR